MSNKNSPLKLYKLGNFTRNAIEEFDNYLESVNANLKNNKNT